MSKDEFFAFMPLLFYGIAVSEIIMHWRDYLKKERRYWPHLITGLILLELAFLNFYYLYDELDELFVNYNQFLFQLSAPLVFLLTVSVYTPENDGDVKEYFKKRTPMIFSLLAIFVGIHIIKEPNLLFINLVRLSAVLTCVLIAVTKNYWFLTIWILIRSALFIIEEFIPHLLV